jgi:COMPASS component SPP1
MSPRDRLARNRPEEEDEDDKLYCLCQQKYVEGEVMLACEKCDEWYHPKCLGISEEEAEKLDNWICSRSSPIRLDRSVHALLRECLATSPPSSPFSSHACP